MWWLSLHDLSWPVVASASTIGSIQLHFGLYEFLFLGIIPGTNYRIDFHGFITATAVLCVLYCTYVLMRILKQRSHKSTAIRQSLDRIAL